MNYKKIPVTLLLTLTAVLGMAPLSHAASLEDAQMKLAGAIGLSARSNSADSGEGVMNVQYIGTGSDPVVTIAATAMTFYSAAGVVDTTIGTAGVVTFASTPGASTLGGLCDYINTHTGSKHRCRLTGGKRDDLPILLRDQTATTGVRTMLGAGANLQFEGASAGGDGSAFVIRQGFTPPSGKRVVLRKCTAINAGVGTLLVYGKTAALANKIVDGIPTPVRNDTTLVWSEPTAAATSLPEDWTTTNGGVGGGIEFATDEHVVVSAGNVATIQIAADFLQCAVEFR